LGIASLVPSSNATGRAFARLLDFERPGTVLELGSGTGAIGQSLLAAGLPPDRLVMVERDPDLVAFLRQRFPSVKVLQGDATKLAPTLERLDISQLSATVSTLPIVWFPLQAQEAVLSTCLDRLGDGGYFLQLTNQPASPLPLKKLGIAGERVTQIWRNFPPCFIWRYWRPRS